MGIRPLAATCAFHKMIYGRQSCDKEMQSKVIKGLKLESCRFSSLFQKRRREGKDEGFFKPNTTVSHLLFFFVSSHFFNFPQLPGFVPLSYSTLLFSIWQKMYFYAKLFDTFIKENERQTPDWKKMHKFAQDYNILHPPFSFNPFTDRLQPMHSDWWGRCID